MASLPDFDDPARVATPGNLPGDHGYRNEDQAERAKRLYMQIAVEETVRVTSEILEVIAGTRKEVDLYGGFNVAPASASDLWDILAEELDGPALHILWTDSPENTALKNDAIARIAARTAAHVAQTVAGVGE